MSLTTKLCCLCVKNYKITINACYVDLDNIKIMDKLIFCIPEIRYNIYNQVVYICTVCHDYLNMLYKFKNGCMKNYKKFLDFISETEKSSATENVFQNSTINVPECSNDTKINIQNNCISEIRPTKEENLIQNKIIFIVVHKTQETEENNCLTNEQYSNTSNSTTFDSSTHQTITNVTNDNDNKKTIDKKEVVGKSSTSNLTDTIPQNDYIPDIKPIKEEKDDYNFTEDEKIIIDVQTDEETEENNCTTDQQSDFGNANTFDVNTYETITAVNNSNEETIDKKNVRKSPKLSNLTDPEKMFSCTNCQRQFSRKVNLKIHQQLHTDEREKYFSCKFCNKHFVYNQTLKVHLRTHTGEKPYLCTICDFRFRHKSNLTNHLRIHSNERPFSCSFCNKHFRHKRSLTTHLITHSDRTPFICTICGKQYEYKTSLNYHMKIIHSGTHVDTGQPLLP